MPKAFVPPAFGRSVKRKEDRRLLTGRGRYTDDLILPGQTYAAFVRSPHAHASINAVDTQHACQTPGVITVLTGNDFATSGLGALTCGWMIHSRNGDEMRATEHPALACDKVRYVGDFQASLDEALRLLDRDGFAVRRDASRRVGKLRGFGIGVYIEAAGIGPSAKLGKMGSGFGMWESAEVRINPTGSVEVLTGCHSHRQSHETTYAQLVADRFGIAIDDIEIIHGDTDKVQLGLGTFGSRSGPVGLSAVACDKVVAKAVRIAAHLLEVPEDSVTFDAGEFASPRTNRRLQFADVAMNAYTAHHFPTTDIEPGLKESCFFDPPNFTFPAGCHVCEVEIDRDTGVVEIIDFAAVDDFGTLVNPMVVEGQVHGGIAQGIGQALLENTVYDEYGQLQSGSFMDYCLPRADDLPDIKVGFTSTPSTSNRWASRAAAKPAPSARHLPSSTQSATPSV